MDRPCALHVPRYSRPPVEQAAPKARQANKKVARQARKVVTGASDGATGGGTLFTEQVLVVNQKPRIYGSKLGCAVSSQSGEPLGVLQELRRDLATKLGDSLRGRSEARRGENTVSS